MKVAALDLGSNTFLCLIAEVEYAHGSSTKNSAAQVAQVTKVYSDNVEMVRLGQDLSKSHPKKFHTDALKRADACLEKFAKIIKEHQPEKILAMATSAARDAENKEELFAIGQKYNIPIEIIPGEKEASITYQGSTSGITSNNTNILVIDIGGGSTEFIFGHDQDLIAGESYNIGCVRLTEKFILNQPTPNEQIKAAENFINESIEKAVRLSPNNFVLNEIIAVAGTPTALVAAQLGFFDPKKIDGFQLTESHLQEWLAKLSCASVDEKIKMGIEKGRADVILIGVIILIQTLKAFNKKSLTVSTRGVRYGVALEIAHRSIRFNSN